VPEIDVEQLMERIRANVRRRRSVEEPRPSNLVSPFDSGQAAADLAFLHSAYDVRNIAFVSHRGGFGPLVVAAKKILRKLLTPILERQVGYNAANARVTTHMKEWIQTLEDLVIRETRLSQELCREIRADQTRLREEFTAVCEDLAMVRDELGATGATVSTMREDLATVRQEAATSRELETTRADFTAAKERLDRAERRLRRLSHVLEASPVRENRGGPRVDGEELAPSRWDVEEPPFDYVEFAEKFRGTEQEIKERQRCYVSYFSGGENVVDIGCGRGEFLELLREHGIKGRGVDVDIDMVLLCKDKGLNVVMDTGYAHLTTLPDNSVDGIFGAQVIEHMPPRHVIDLVRLCHRKLAPGAALVLETPNPTCLMVFADSFYKDPSHVQPAHPDTMRFLFRATGFEEVALKFLAPVDPDLRLPSLPASAPDVEPFNRGIERLNTLLFGFQDYAVIGRKAPATPRPEATIGTA
jgi:2-polyprenyl-3-methyl-5-hydroxy-6-metoxy-1,4-benzoquinol methylase